MSAETDLTNALFAAAAAPDGPEAPDALWHDFLLRLAEVTRAESAVLQLRWPDIAPRLWRAGTDWDGPGLQVGESMRPGRVYSQVDLPGQDAADPPQRALCQPLDGNGIALLAIRRAGRDFRALDGVHLSRLVAYLGPALSIWRRRRAERAQAALDRGLCHDFGIGWIVFSAAGRVQESSAGLMERLRAQAGISLRADGRLSLPGEDAGQALHQALARAGGGAGGGASGETGAGAQVMLSTDPPVRMSLRQEGGGGEQRLIGRVRLAQIAGALPLERLLACFDLSRSEARLAMRLCDGMSLREAAADLGWTEETTRSCSKSIYARLHVRGQPGVVREMLQSTVWFGPSS